MKKILVSVLALLFLHAAFAQTNNIQGPTLGVHFFLNDFEGAQKVRSTSFSTAIREKEFGKLKEMTPGIALNYIQGITKYVDVSSTLAGSFIDYPQRTRAPFNRDFFLLEGDISFRGKLLPNNYWISPYLQAGVGVSKYKGYFDAFIPAGVGIQVNIFDEAYLLLNSQYRIPVTESANYHFYFSIGLAGSIGKKNTPDTVTPQ